MSENPEILGANALIEKVTTLSSNLGGGFRITLDFAESDIKLFHKLAEIKFQSGAVAVAFQRLEDIALRKEKASKGEENLHGKMGLD